MNLKRVTGYGRRKFENFFEIFANYFFASFSEMLMNIVMILRIMAVS